MSVDSPKSCSEQGSPWQAAIDAGIDVAQLDYLLTLTPEQRLIRHEKALELVRALRQAAIDFYGFDPRLITESCDR